MIRYEFVELITRIAFDKYYRSKITKTITEAVEKLLKEDLESVMLTYNAGNVLRNKLFTEECENVFRCYMPCLEQLFDRFSKRKTLPGQIPFVSIEEFRELCITSGLQTNSLMIRDFDICYAYSMGQQIDEIYQKKHMEMRFSEFIEALSRVADISNISSPSDDNQSLLDASKLPLHMKIKNCLVHLSKKLGISPSKRISNRFFVRRKTFKIPHSIIEISHEEPVVD